MKVERLHFKQFTGSMQLDATTGSRVFLPSKAPKAEELPLPPPPPVFSEAELNAAERDGYQKGFLAGLEDGRKQAENQQAEVNEVLVKLMDKFVASVSPLFNDYLKVTSKLRQGMPQIALAVAKKVAGVALEQNAPEVIMKIAENCCETMINEAELTITAHESLADTLERKLHEMATRLPEATHIIILRDPTMPLTDIRIDWEKGFMERCTNELWQRVEKVISDMSMSAAFESAKHSEELLAKLPPADEISTSEKE